MIIAIDFDGTCVTHAYPKLGCHIGAPPVLTDLVKAGHKLILYTMRSGNPLRDAVQWFEDHEIPLWGVNKNPQQHEWTTSNKVYAHLYIDDAALGIPLIENKLLSYRPYVDWSKVREMLIERDIL